MRPKFWVMIPLLLGAGCVSATPRNADALCAGSRAARAEHAMALAASHDERALITGQRLIALLDAGCG